MACCLSTPSHYLNETWPVTSKAHLHSNESHFIGDTSTIITTISLKIQISHIEFKNSVMHVTSMYVHLPSSTYRKKESWNFEMDKRDQCGIYSALHTLMIQCIPRNMHTVFALLCFVVDIHWLIFPYPSGLLHWHCGNLTIAPVPAKQPWLIWINTSCEFIMNDCITTTKQSTTQPCAYFLGYTVCTSKCRLWYCVIQATSSYKMITPLRWFSRQMK